VFGFTVTPRGLVVVANEGRAEERQLYRVPLQGGAATRVSVRPGTHTPVVSADGRMAAVLFSSDTVPPDLFVTDLTASRPAMGSEQRVTTSPRADFATYRWPAPRYVTFTSRADGATLHGRLLLAQACELLCRGKALRAFARALRRHVEATTDDVGDRFADEAIRMHHGDIEHRAIRGRAGPDEARMLIEEGVGFMPLPALPEDRN
jgi:hypothetical protein